MRVEKKTNIAWGVKYVIWEGTNCLGVFRSRRRAVRRFKKLERKFKKVVDILRKMFHDRFLKKS